MSYSLPYKQNSLLFAPMEGITDTPYRRMLHKTFPEWDRYFTDFLRIPTSGKITSKIIRDHIGESVLKNHHELDKTSFQILTTEKAQTQEFLKLLNELPIKHLDLNLGCPSRKVNSHGGGAYLLSDLRNLANIINIIRQNFNHCFTVKMRLGYRDDSLFFDSLKLLEDHGVDGITIHGRTRDELYQGTARWGPIANAVQKCKIPIIGNGDIWNLEDIQQIFHQCGCHSVMIARGALKTPWLATLKKEYNGKYHTLTAEKLLEIRQGYLELYFLNLEKEYRRENFSDDSILKRFKAMSRYLFDDYPESSVIRSMFLRATSLAKFLDVLFHELPSVHHAYA